MYLQIIVTLRYAPKCSVRQYWRSYTNKKKHVHTYAHMLMDQIHTVVHVFVGRCLATKIFINIELPEGYR